MLGVHFGNGFSLGQVETGSGAGGVGDLIGGGFFVVAEDLAVECEWSFYPDFWREYDSVAV